MTPKPIEKLAYFCIDIKVYLSLKKFYHWAAKAQFSHQCGVCTSKKFLEIIVCFREFAKHQDLG